MLDDDDIFDAQQEAAREEYEMQLREQFIPEMYEEFARDLMSGKDHLYDEVIEQFTSERLQSFYRPTPRWLRTRCAHLKKREHLNLGNPLLLWSLPPSQLSTLQGEHVGHLVQTAPPRSGYRVYA